MNNNFYLKWIQLHNNDDFRKNELSEILFNSWERSYGLGIDAENSLPKFFSEEEFNNKKDSWKSLYYYSNDALTTISKRYNNFNMGFALFSTSSCLIKLYGNQSFHEWALKNNIRKGSIWNESIIGTNAVSLGFKIKKAISIVGEEHFSKFAINTAMYFAPIIYEKDANGNSEYGGIAIFTPIEYQNPSYIITVDSIARSIALQFFWFESIHLFVNYIDGYIVVDQSNNKNKVIFISKQVFNFLDLPYRNIYYDDLEKIIDPYPKNKKFWDLVNNKISVQDVEMKLSIQGKYIYLNLSIRPYCGKSFHIEGVSIIINSHERIQNLISKHTTNNTTFTFDRIIGTDEKHLNILSQAKAAAESDINVLLLGESGVGKDVVAQSIHNASKRKDKPFIAVNCAAFPKDLISSELFGYEEGAFTGAKKGGHMGKFELANHGTLFLDEIGDMPLDLQAILLRVLEQKSFMKIGSTKATHIDVRIITATNKNLLEKIETGEFRKDLYYRLGVIKLTIPPLKNRNNDVLLLAEHFIDKICKRINKPKVTLSQEVKDFFLEYNWPGNVRELQNMLEGVIQIYDSPEINYEHISNYLMHDPISQTIQQNNLIAEDNSKTEINIKPTTLKDISKKHIIHALEVNKYNKTQTAKYLGISRKTLYRRLKEYGLM